MLNTGAFGALGNGHQSMLQRMMKWNVATVKRMLTSCFKTFEVLCKSPMINL